MSWMDLYFAGKVISGAFGLVVFCILIIWIIYMGTK